MREKNIPKTIWMIWLQGLSEAPFIVRKCVESWRRENPGWDVVVLDEESLNNYIVPDIPESELQKLTATTKSDLFRLQLLSDYGGVWADATTYCMRPLDGWIDECAKSGFFAFYKPGRDRVISSWFMVSEKECPVTVRMRDQFAAFFMVNRMDNNRMKIARSLLSRMLNRSERTTRYWFTPLVTKYLKVYPYFVFHYMFERVVSTDEESKEIWGDTKKVDANPLHKVVRGGLCNPVTDDIIKEISEKKTPVYKLSWKYDHGEYSSDTVLYYLLEGRFGQ